MNLIFGASRPHHSRGSIAHLVTKPCYETEKSVTKPVTKPILRVTKPRDETTKFVTKPVTKPLFFAPPYPACYETVTQPHKIPYFITAEWRA